jgi:hypothetical protein
MRSTKQNLTGRNKMKKLTTISEIKKAVDKGLTVKSGNDSYDVIKNKHGEYLIVCSFNGYTIGLHGQAGTKYENVLNADDIYIHAISC